MKIITSAITLIELKQMAESIFGNMVKGVVDVDNDVLALDAELHADIEAYLLEQGSKQQALWGINLYPDMDGENFVEFDSMINMRPSQGNNSRDVLDPVIRKKIKEIVLKKVQK